MANTPDAPQSFTNHTRFDPMYHYFTVPTSLAFVAWSLVRLVTSPSADTLYFMIGALALFGAGSVARLSPLRAQDRLIRLEEQLRYARLLPADLAAEAAEKFGPRRYVALRFAGDQELEGLVREALRRPEMTGKELKQQIKHWRGDYFRV